MRSRVFSRGVWKVVCEKSYVKILCEKSVWKVVCEKCKCKKTQSQLIGPKIFLWNFCGNHSPRGKIMQKIDCDYSRSMKIFHLRLKLKKIDFFNIFSNKKINIFQFWTSGVDFRASGIVAIDFSHDFTPRRVVLAKIPQKIFFWSNELGLSPPL